MWEQKTKKQSKNKSTRSNGVLVDVVDKHNQVTQEFVKGMTKINHDLSKSSKRRVHVKE